MSFMTLFSDSGTDCFTDKREESFHERPIAAKAVSSFRTETADSLCSNWAFMEGFFPLVSKTIRSAVAEQSHKRHFDGSRSSENYFFVILSYSGRSGKSAPFFLH